jgi:hypothetical protein
MNQAPVRKRGERLAWPVNATGRKNLGPGD